MTWAVFLLWAEDTYEDGVFDRTVNWVVAAMTGYRGFPRFAEFFTALRGIRNRAPAGSRIEDLYPQLLGWAATYPLQGSLPSQ